MACAACPAPGQSTCIQAFQFFVQVYRSPWKWHEMRPPDPRVPSPPVPVPSNGHKRMSPTHSSQGPSSDAHANASRESRLSSRSNTPRPGPSSNGTPPRSSPTQPSAFRHISSSQPAEARGNGWFGHSPPAGPHSLEIAVPRPSSNGNGRSGMNEIECSDAKPDATQPQKGARMEHGCMNGRTFPQQT